MEVSAPRHKLLKGFQFVACGCYCCTVASPNRRLLLTWATLGSSSAHKAYTHTHTHGDTHAQHNAHCVPPSDTIRRQPHPERGKWLGVDVITSAALYAKHVVSKPVGSSQQRISECVCVWLLCVCGCTIDFLLCCNCCFGQVAVASGETDRQAGKAGTAGADVEARNSFACSRRRKTALIQFQLHCRHCMLSVRLLSGHCVAVVVELARERERESHQSVQNMSTA